MAFSKEVQDFVSRNKQNKTFLMKFPAKAASVFETNCYHVWKMCMTSEKYID